VGLIKWLLRLLFSGAEDVAVQAALQWGLMRWLFRLLFSEAEDVAVRAALQ
jgi:hypothetical protein